MITAKQFDEMVKDGVKIKEPELPDIEIKNCNQIASNILQENKLLFCDGIYYKYDNGVFLSIKEDKIRRIIKDKLGDKFTQNKASEIIHSLRVEIALNDSEELNASALLNLKNGMFNLEKMAIAPHEENFKSTIQLPVSYNPGVKCDKWFETLKGIFPDDIEKADIIQEFFGLCLTKDQKYEKALFLVGDGANGKSTLLYILQKILGKRNFSSVPLELFNNPHYTANFYQKLVNISIETNAKSSVYDSLMKAVISGDNITADAKYQPTIQFNPFCKLIFALNNMPRVDDKTDAFYRRMLIVRFNRQFEEAEQNKNLKFELEAEIDGIFNWMVEGLKRLRGRGYFELTEALRQEVDEYRKENNNVIAFVEDACKLEGNTTSKQALYSAYTEWCDSNGYRKLSKNKLGMEIKKQFRGKIQDDRDTTGERAWYGVSLNCVKLEVEP